MLEFFKSTRDVLFYYRDRSLNTNMLPALQPLPLAVGRLSYWHKLPQQHTRYKQSMLV